MFKKICCRCNEIYIPTGKRQKICPNCKISRGGRPKIIKISETIGMCQTGGIKKYDKFRKNK